jgi:Glycosyltransferase family 28 C-terminal domain
MGKLLVGAMIDWLSNLLKYHVPHCLVSSYCSGTVCSIVHNGIGSTLGATCRARRIGAPIKARSHAAPTRAEARAALGLADSDLVLTVATHTLGAAAMYDLVHSVAPRLLSAIPNLRIYHETGIFGSVDVTGRADSSGLAPASPWPSSDSSDSPADEASSRRAVSPKPSISPAAATASPTRLHAPASAASTPPPSKADPQLRGAATLPPDRYFEVPFFGKDSSARHAQLVASDLVLSRGGAITCAEVLAAGVASVLMPAPLAQDSHEYFNAVAMETTGAAVLAPASRPVPEDEQPDDADEAAAAVARRLQDTEELLLELLQDRERRGNMATCAREAARPDAARVAAAGLEALAADPRNKDVEVLRPYAPVLPA